MTDPVLLSKWGSSDNEFSATKDTLDIMKTVIQGNVSMNIKGYLNGLLYTDPIMPTTAKWRIPRRNLGFDVSAAPGGNIGDILEKPYVSVMKALVGSNKIPSDLVNAKTVSFSLEDGTRVTISLDLTIERSKDSRAVVYVDESSLLVRAIKQAKVMDPYMTAVENQKIEYLVTVVPGSKEYDATKPNQYGTSRIPRRMYEYLQTGPSSSARDSSNDVPKGDLDLQKAYDTLVEKEKVVYDKVPEKLTGDVKFAGEIVIALKGKFFLPIVQLSENTIKVLVEQAGQRIENDDWKALILASTREQFIYFLQRMIPRGIRVEVDTRGRSSNYFNINPKNEYSRDFQGVFKLGELPLQSVYTINLLPKKADSTNVRLYITFTVFSSVSDPAGRKRSKAVARVVVYAKTVAGPKKPPGSIPPGTLYNIVVQADKPFEVEANGFKQPITKGTKYTIQDIEGFKDAASNFTALVKGIMGEYPQDAFTSQLFHVTLQSGSIMTVNKATDVAGPSASITSVDIDDDLEDSTIYDDITGM